MFGPLIVAFSCIIFIINNTEGAAIRQNYIRNFAIRIQPDLDAIDMENFVKKDHVIKFQLKCLLNNDTYCDPVGRWLAPRLPYILLTGKCPKCTDVQQQKIVKALAYIRRERPEIFQALWNRYIDANDDELSLMSSTENATQESLNKANETNDMEDDVSAKSL